MGTRTDPFGTGTSVAQGCLGHNHTEADIKTRVRQLMMHADIGREEAQLPAFPLLRPASESFADELNPSRETKALYVPAKRIYPMLKRVGLIKRPRWMVLIPTN